MEILVAENSTPARAYVTATDGTRYTFGDFVDSRQRESKRSVQDVVRDAKISRANYYLLKKDEQRPTLPTAVALLAALGLRSEVPPSDDDFEVDLHVYDGDARYDLVFEWTPDDRSRARARFLSSADLGTAAGAAAVAVGLEGAAVAALAGGLGAAMFPVAGPLAAAVFVATRQVKKAREQQRREQEAKGQEPAPSAAKEDLIEDFKAAADDMSTEDLEALLTAMKALRDSNSA